MDEEIIEEEAFYEVSDVCLRCGADIGEFNDVDNGEQHEKNLKAHTCPPDIIPGAWIPEWKPKPEDP